MDHLPQTTASRAGSLPLVGGILALDFCNTSSGRDTNRPIEHLQTADNVLAWVRHAGIVAAGEAEALALRLGGDHCLGPDLLCEAHRLRDALFAIGKAIAGQTDVPRIPLDTLGEFYARAIGRAKLVERYAEVGWHWTTPDSPIEAVLGPIALSGLKLMTETEPRRVKQCHGHQCGWLFYDATKNNSRRWCEMDVCGNRAKQRRHQRRRSEEHGSEASV